MGNYTVNMTYPQLSTPMVLASGADITSHTALVDLR